MAAIHPPTPLTAPVEPEPLAPTIVFPDDGDQPVAAGSLLEADLRRDLAVGIGVGFLVVFVTVTVALTITNGWAYGLGVGAMAAFWCGTGFGLIAGAAAYALKTNH